MKIYKGFLLLLLSITIGNLTAQENLAEFNQKLEQFYASYLDKGKVDYLQIFQEKEEITSLSKYLYNSDITDFSESKTLAFYINAYNLLVIKSVIDNFPINSPKERGNFFNNNLHLIAGSELSLDQLESKIFQLNNDPRIHFALVCGAKGCPPLKSIVYQEDKLEMQLDQKTKSAINNKSFIRPNPEIKKVRVSEIFNWYKSDFINDNQTIIQYINQYRVNKIPKNYKLDYYDFDWALNGKSKYYDWQVNNGEGDEDANSILQTYTPSALFAKGDYEINLLNSLYAQTKVRDREGNAIEIGQSQAFLSSTIQYTVGVSNNSKFNIGVDVRFASARYSVNTDNSPIDYFNRSDAFFKKTIVSAIGPRIKFIPFQKIPRLSLQSTFLFPISKELEKTQFIDHDRYTWWNQLFYDQSLSNDFQLFLEADFLYRINRNSIVGRNFFRLPLSAFLSYFPNEKSTIFTFVQYSPRFERVSNDVDSQFGLSQWFTQMGGGVKYQILDNLGLELSYGNFIASRLDGAGYNLNFGIRYIHR